MYKVMSQISRSYWGEGYRFANALNAFNNVTKNIQELKYYVGKLKALEVLLGRILLEEAKKSNARIQPGESREELARIAEEDMIAIIKENFTSILKQLGIDSPLLKIPQKIQEQFIKAFADYLQQTLTHRDAKIEISFSAFNLAADIAALPPIAGAGGSVARGAVELAHQVYRAYRPPKHIVVVGKDGKPIHTDQKSQKTVLEKISMVLEKLQTPENSATLAVLGFLPGGSIAHFLSGLQQVWLLRKHVSSIKGPNTAQLEYKPNGKPKLPPLPPKPPSKK